TVRHNRVREHLGYEKITLKGGRCRIQLTGQDEYFKSDLFGAVLGFVQANSKTCRLKDTVGRPTLTVENILSVRAALDTFSPLLITLGKPGPL
ncbi:MAG TPA: hypothetical protein PK059_13235, partial [Cyclobacteriaceae bacterium]|nr:hypothetical protein [Cyclobacteriaceae bacterium]